MGLFDDMDAGVSGCFAVCEADAAAKGVQKMEPDCQFDFDNLYGLCDLFYVSQRQINADFKHLSGDKFYFYCSALRFGL